MKNDARARGAWQGMNWIRQTTRLAIYLRDGLACAYCKATGSLTLDHVIPHSLGGSNEPTNLLTACETCNKSRGTRDLREFVYSVAAYKGLDAQEILAFVKVVAGSDLKPYRAKANALVSTYGSAAKVVAALSA